MSGFALVFIAAVALGAAVLWRTPKHATFDRDGWRGCIGLPLIGLGVIGLIIVGIAALVADLT